MAKLVIFDIDGTLVNSTHVDAVCFVRSVKDEFGIDEIDERWENYREATDSGIFEEIFERAFDRKPSESEIRTHVDSFLNLLKKYFLEDAELFQEVKGAREIVEVLKSHQEWKVGIATGAWEESALFKLRSAGIDAGGIPIVTSSQAKSREAILRKCIEDSKNHYGVDGFQKIVSVGDAVWDLRTANKLNIAFIAVDVSGKSGDFSDCRVLRDYSEQARCMAYLEEAEVPAA